VKKINTLGGDMHKWTVRAARLALVAAAITAAGTGVANADDTTGDHSILGGEQIHIPIIAPIGLFGNHVNLLSSGIPMGARFAHIRTDNDPDAMAPQMDICGNAISSANGIGTASCKGQAMIGGPEAAPAWAPPAVAPAAWVPAAPPAEESPNPRIGAPATSIGAPGSPVAPQPEMAPPAAPPAAAPAAAQAAPPADACAPCASVQAPEQAPAEAPAAGPVQAPEAVPVAAPQEAPVAVPATEMSTSGDFGVLSGNQVKAPVRMPIRVCGNAGALGGVATAACEGTASSGRLGHHGAFRSLGVAGLLG
jgi:ChpA-C